MDRRGAVERRGVADEWRAAQPDAWRLEAFKAQVIQESRHRREVQSLRLAVLGGVVLGVAGCFASLIG